eukprot:1171878-Rhodomonas_salina.2
MTSSLKRVRAGSGWTLTSSESVCRSGGATEPATPRPLARLPTRQAQPRHHVALQGLVGGWGKGFAGLRVE